VRVLHVVPSIAVGFGGPSNVPGLVRALTAAGIDATLVTTNDDPVRRFDVPFNERVVRDGVAYVFHRVWAIAGHWALAPSLLLTLRRMIGHCDLVHIHWLYNFPCIVAAWAALIARVPFVVQPRASLDPHMFRKNRLLKRLYLATAGRPLLSSAAAVVFTAERERDLAAHPVARPAWIVPNGVDLSAFERLPPRGSFRAAYAQVTGPFLLFLGRLSRQKGLDLLLPAFQRLARSRPDLWLVLAGPDHEGYEAHVRELTRELGLDDRVVFTGLLTGERKLAAFVDAELFVLPSYAENFGMTIIEALACGLPVVISNQVNIYPDLAAAGAATMVRCTVDSVVDGIESALADTGARQRIAALGPDLVRARYSWDAVVPALVRHYEEVIRA